MIALSARNVRTVEGRCVHGGGIDRYRNIYAGLTQDRSVDKFAQKGLSANFSLARASALIMTCTTFIFARDPC